MPVGGICWASVQGCVFLCCCCCPPLCPVVQTLEIGVMISKLQSLVYAGAPFAMDRWLTSMLDKCGSPFAVVRARKGERDGGLLAVHSTFARICLYSAVMTVPACAF